MKLILLIFTAFFSTLVHAQKVVPVVWPFAIGSSQANMFRSIIETANTQQTKYQFILMHKPGAGGAVAAKTVAESKDLSVLASTSSFYIRPLLYKDSHNIDDFNMVSLVCSNQPLAIFSKKINKLSDVQGREITLGIISGSITTLVTKAIKRENPSIKVSEVPYKGTPEATSDMLGGHIDGSVDFIGTSVTSRFGNDIKVLGMTGTRSINNYPTFKSVNVNGLENITNDYFYFVNKSVDATTREELHKILTNAYNEKTKFLCEDDFGQIGKLGFNQIDALNQSNKTRWGDLTKGIVKE